MAGHSGQRDSCCSVNIVTLPKHEQFSSCASVFVPGYNNPKSSKNIYIFTIFSIQIEVRILKGPFQHRFYDSMKAVDMQDAYQLASVKK